jgi:hypothetical protein
VMPPLDLRCDENAFVGGGGANARAVAMDDDRSNRTMEEAELDDDDLVASDAEEEEEEEEKAGTPIFIRRMIDQSASMNMIYSVRSSEERMETTGQGNGVACGTKRILSQ